MSPSAVSVTTIFAIVALGAALGFLAGVRKKMNLEQCLRLAKAAGFDGIELNYDLDNDLSPKSGPKEYAVIRTLASKIKQAESPVPQREMREIKLNGGDGRHTVGPISAAHDALVDVVS